MNRTQLSLGGAVLLALAPLAMPLSHAELSLTRSVVLPGGRSSGGALSIASVAGQPAVGFSGLPSGATATGVHHGFFDAAECVFDLDATALAPFSNTGGTQTLTLTTNPGCAWTTSGVPSWMTLTPSTGPGGAAIQIQCEPNPGPARSAELIIAGHAVPVSQLGTSVAFWALY